MQSPKAVNILSEIAASKIDSSLCQTRSGWTEQNPEDWWQGAVTVAARVMAAQIEREYLPNPAHEEAYGRLFDIYRQLYPALKPQFDSLAQV